MFNAEDLGKLILRATLAILILFHGVAKVVGGPGSVASAVVRVGLPPEFGYLVYVGEVIAPLLLLAGIWSRIAAAIIAVNMGFAIWLVHTSQIFTLSNSGGWALELQGMFLAAAVALILLGAGRYSIGGSGGKWN
jgi:putative oxidoreductase